MSTSEGAGANSVLLRENRPPGTAPEKTLLPASQRAEGGGAGCWEWPSPGRRPLLKKAGGWWEGSFLPGASPDPDSSPTIDLPLQLWGSSSWKGPGPPSLCQKPACTHPKRTFLPLASEHGLPAMGHYSLRPRHTSEFQPNAFLSTFLSPRIPSSSSASEGLSLLQVTPFICRRHRAQSPCPPV